MHSWCLYRPHTHFKAPSRKQPTVPHTCADAVPRATLGHALCSMQSCGGCRAHYFWALGRLAKRSSSTSSSIGGGISRFSLSSHRVPFHFST